jgi:hypothetical protein
MIAVNVYEIARRKHLICIYATDTAISSEIEFLEPPKWLAWAFSPSIEIKEGSLPPDALFALLVGQEVYCTYEGSAPDGVRRAEEIVALLVDLLYIEQYDF